jgi:hypothetical protein
VQIVDVLVQEPTVTTVEIVEFGGPPIGYPQLPAALRQLPIAVPFGGQVTTDMLVYVPMGFAVIVPPGLAGAQAYARGKATSPAVFTFNRVSGGVKTPLGTVTLTPASNTSCVLAGPGGSLAVGDVIEAIAPQTQDPTLGDVGITIMADRAQQ